MGLSVKGMKQGMEILGGAVLKKFLRLGMCMGPSPKMKEPSRMDLCIQDNSR